MQTLYIQDLVKSLTIFCISLLVCLPVAISVDLVSDISEEGEFLGAGESDFIINVKYYEPRPLTSSTIEKGNAPVFIHLMAIPNFPTQSLPKIQHVSVRETGSNVLTGGVRYNEPSYYTWDNFGFLQVKLKQIPKEDDVPDIIKANLTARIRYETDVVPGLLVGGAMSKTLGEYKLPKDKKEIEWNDITGKDEYKFFGGSIVVEKIYENRVNLILFNNVGRKQRISVSEGKEVGPYYLVSGSTNLQDQVRIRVDSINYKEGSEDNKVSFSLMAGKKRGESEVSFTLNIPVDKRLFNLTHEDIKEEIEWTKDRIEDLNNTIENLEEQIEWFYSACLITTALVLTGRLFGIGKAATEGAAKETLKETVAGVAAGEAAEKTIGALDKEETTIYSSNYDGENLLLIPINNVVDLPSTPAFDTIKEWYEKEENKNKHLYAAYSNKNGLTFYIRKGKVMDYSTNIGGDELDLPLTQTYNVKSIEFRTFTSSHIRKIQNAQGNKEPFKIGSTTYTGVDTTRSILSDKASTACIDFMSPGQCKLIFNFCDPVVCPTSRCSFRESIKGSVQEAGLFVSLFGFLKNFKEGVLVPFCLTGIQASLKNIRSYLQGYERCLETRLETGESVGFCDRTRSIFMCEIIWRHFLDPSFNWIGNKMSRRNPIAGGSGVAKDALGAVARTKSTLNYFTQDYAKNIVAGYKGKYTKEIGVSVCQSAISGRFPDFGEIMQDLAEGGTPTQYTAQFEEHPYSAATGNSRYFGYYHIYAGSVENAINYAVYLKNCGGKNIQIKRGSIQPENFADESFEQPGTSGCKEICVVVDGETNCAFGKMVSTNVVIQDTVDNFVASQAGRQISLERDCIPTGEAYLGASINRQCSIIKPGDNWIKVGVCKKSATDVRDKIPPCWVEIDTQDKDMMQQIERNVCSGNICNRNQECKEGETTNIRDSFDVCCLGKCENKAFFKNVEEVIISTKDKLERRTGLIYPQWVYLDEWYEAGLKKTGDVDNRGIITNPTKQFTVSKLIEEKPDGIYYYLAMLFLFNADYENAEKIAFMIKNDICMFDEVGKVIGLAWSKYDYHSYQQYLERYGRKLLTFKTKERTDCEVGITRERTDVEKPEEQVSGVVVFETLPLDTLIKNLRTGDKITFSDGTMNTLNLIIGEGHFSYYNEDDELLFTVEEESTSKISVLRTLYDVDKIQRAKKL